MQFSQRECCNRSQTRPARSARARDLDRRDLDSSSQFNGAQQESPVRASERKKIKRFKSPGARHFKFQTCLLLLVRAAATNKDQQLWQFASRVSLSSSKRVACRWLQRQTISPLIATQAERTPSQKTRSVSPLAGAHYRRRLSAAAALIGAQQNLCAPFIDRSGDRDAIVIYEKIVSQMLAGCQMIMSAPPNPS